MVFSQIVSIGKWELCVQLGDSFRGSYSIEKYEGHNIQIENLLKDLDAATWEYKYLEPPEHNILEYDIIEEFEKRNV